MTAPTHAGHRNGGFSLIELIVTVVLAGIIFLAMVPLFVSGLKNTSTNTRRVVATNLAQARIEKVRILADGPSPGTTAGPTGFAAITQANLNSATFDGGLFATTYTPPAGGQAYNITTNVSTDSTSAPYKTVTVTVSRPNDGFQTTVNTVIMNPLAVTTTSTSGPTGGNGPFSMTVAFKNYTEVSSKGVYVVYVNTSPTPNVTTTATPTKQVPSASATTCTWTNLPGGMNYLYTVYCNSSDYSTVLYTPAFHMLSNGWVKFDTNPGGS
jgi:prepilin-type N-terminal cleavage/methylation domain-containing protein